MNTEDGGTGADNEGIDTEDGDDTQTALERDMTDKYGPRTE